MRSLRDKQTPTDLCSEKDEQENKCDPTLRLSLSALVWLSAKNYRSTATRGIVHYGLRDGGREVRLSGESSVLILIS